jgi:hypothetical protein
MDPASRAAGMFNLIARLPRGGLIKNTLNSMKSLDRLSHSCFRRGDSASRPYNAEMKFLLFVNAPASASNVSLQPLFDKKYFKFNEIFG